MSDLNNLSDDYQRDVVDSRAKRPHGVAAGWICLVLLVLIAVVGFGFDRVFAVRLVAAPGGAPAGRHADPPAISLAEELGLFSDARSAGGRRLSCAADWRC